jgi:predicted TPR repeat methyltransferase
MHNVFESAPEFIDNDNRRSREVNCITAESTYNRLSVQLPDWVVKDATVLDLGCCLGAAGHMALTNSAKHYTGVEIQETYVTQSREIFSKYWNVEQYSIIHDNIENFLDRAITEGIQYDVVIASGVLYAFLNIISILEKIAKISKKTVIIDTVYVRNDVANGIILIRPNYFINHSEGNTTFKGVAASLNLKALDTIMMANLFQRTEEMIIPPITNNSHDGYSDMIDFGNGVKTPARYMARYYRNNNFKFKTLRDKIVNNDTSDLEPFRTLDPTAPTQKASSVAWTFDSAVADRFQQEAEQHIPDYKRVINLCLDIANRNLNKTDNIIDIGSALGFTVDKFMSNGFSNIYGVDNSNAMVSRSMHKDRITVSDCLPNQFYKMVLINWTLHFIQNKIAYLEDVYNKLESGGFLIISDKTSQSPELQSLYYKFKEDNGVPLEYIKEKEISLRGIMHTLPPSWYFTHLTEIGFTAIEILNSKFGFVTFICRKP